MTVKSLEELTEVLLGVVWPRGGLRMILDGENGVLLVSNTFYGAIIEVKVRHLERFRTWYTARIPPNRESMVL